MINYFNQKRRSGVDRRTGEERRKALSLDYFSDHFVERRKGGERRTKGEMREDWVRVTRFSSAPLNVSSSSRRPEIHRDRIDLR